MPDDVHQVKRGEIKVGENVTNCKEYVPNKETQNNFQFLFIVNMQEYKLKSCQTLQFSTESKCGCFITPFPFYVDNYNKNPYCMELEMKDF